jgi:hemerythrin-like domain-containing protein
MVLYFLHTFVIEHCREEEKALFAQFQGRVATPEQIQTLRQEHESFGVDLDRFERQMASFQLSGDPSVLVTLGTRIIRETREHLKAEDALLAAWSANRQEALPGLERAGPNN